MHKEGIEHYLKAVETLNEGQLLQQTAEFLIVQDKTQTFDIRAQTGRGDVYGFMVWFVGLTTDLSDIFYSVLINGNEVNVDLRALAYSVNFLVGVDENLSTGTGRITKSIYRIPESSTVTIEVTAAAIGGPQKVFMFINSYYTTKFIGRRMGFNLTQNFQSIFVSGTQTQKTFLIPAQRGRIVGLSCFLNQDPSQIDRPEAGFKVELNGILVLENVMPVQFLNHMNMMEANNWIVNVDGGGLLRVTMDNLNGEDVRIGITLYFSDKLPTKRATGTVRKQLPVKSER